MLRMTSRGIIASARRRISKNGNIDTEIQETGDLLENKPL
jgi:hypothetical protein